MTMRRSVFFFNDTATTEIYTLSLHDALPISPPSMRSPIRCWSRTPRRSRIWSRKCCARCCSIGSTRSEEHTSELQSRLHLVCRLLLEKKKKLPQQTYTSTSPPADHTDSILCP